MASEAQRAARALVEERVDRFESRHSMEDSRSRLEAAMSRARTEGRVVFTPEWRETEGKILLDARFAPPRRVGTVVKSLSILATLLILATAWSMLSHDTGASAAWVLALFTGLMILTMPWVFVAMGSSRLAEEDRILRAIRAALMDEDEKLPPVKEWDP
jgi:hypothetical protein